MGSDKNSQELRAALRQIERLRAENEALRQALNATSPKVPQAERPLGEISDPAPPVHQRSPAATKVALFRSFFRGREDVYPLRWENRQGKSGRSDCIKRTS